jgi:hypothetical protein
VNLAEPLFELTQGASKELLLSIWPVALCAGAIAGGGGQTGYMDYDLRFFDHETGRLENIDNPFAVKVLPMSSV